MGWFSKEPKSSMQWEHLTKLNQLHNYIEQSKERPIVLFKHSTRCIISSMAKDRMERNWKENYDAIPVYLDLIQYREISNALASELEVEHQSPQMIILNDGKVVFHTSHNQVDPKAVEPYLD